MTAAAATRHKVLCVDDNPLIREALQSKLQRAPSLEWIGALPDASDLISKVESECPAIVILDLDMPGPDPLLVLKRLSAQCPNTRVVVFTGHVRRDFVDRAIDAGAWAYISKNE